MTERPDGATPSNPSLDLSEETQALARRIRESMESWVGRMAGSAGAGRSATSVARMATARTISELRGLALGGGVSEAETAVADYLRRSRSLLTQAAHDIERNRYSLQLMDMQMHRLDELVKRIFPGEADAEAQTDDVEIGAKAGEAPESGSAETARSADDRGADGKVSPR